MASPSSNPLLSTADFGSPRSHAGMQLASPSGLPSSNNMVASINSLTEKMKALETPDRLASFQEGVEARAWLGQFEVLAHGKGWNSSDILPDNFPPDPPEEDKGIVRTTSRTASVKMLQTREKILIQVTVILEM